jgi:hypothetical protein
VVRPHARRIVALVEYVHPIWNRAVSHFVAQSMGEARLPTGPQLAVPACNGVGRPLPTPVRLGHLRPEPLVGAGEMVVRIDAKRLVARARHPRFGRKRAVRNLPRNPDSGLRLARRNAEYRTAAGGR